MADFVVLTEGAQKITGAEENGPGSAGSDQGGFFPKVALKTGNSNLSASAANAGLPLQTISTATPGTKAAGTKYLNRLKGSFLQTAIPVKTLVLGDRFFHALTAVCQLQKIWFS